MLNFLLDKHRRAIQFLGRPFRVAIWLRIEVDAVGDSDKHVAVGDAVVLGHAHTDAVASGVDHGLSHKHIISSRPTTNCRTRWSPYH